MKAFIITFENGDRTVVIGADSEKDAIEAHKFCHDICPTYKIDKVTDLIQQYKSGTVQILLEI